MAVNNSESNYPPPVPPSRRANASADDNDRADGNEPNPSQDETPDLQFPSLDDFDLSDVGELMALNIGLDEPAIAAEEAPAQPEPEPSPEAEWPPNQLVNRAFPEPEEPEQAEFTPTAYGDFDAPVPSNLGGTESNWQTINVDAFPSPVEDPQPVHDQYLPPRGAEQGYPHHEHPQQTFEVPPPPRPHQGSIARATTGDGPTALLMETLSRSPWMVVGAAVAVLGLVATANWVAGSSADEEAQGGSELLTTPDVSETNDTPGTDGSIPLTEPAPLSPAAIPPSDQPGLVGFEVDLFDPYSGRGTTGTVDLYLNAVSGQVCHQFDADVMNTSTSGGRYRAYIHEAIYPREGPIVVDLGEAVSALPQCVTASPIELARFMTTADQFYIAAHSPDRDVLLRGQLSSAVTAFDNRDEATKAEQAATADASDTTPTTTGPNALFGTADEGAYLVVDAGKVTFEGAVADAATASRLQSAFIPLAGLGVEVVDNLTIETGAPAPSGRVVVADALLFGSGQDEIDGSPLVLTTLADLLRVNPTWTATITGHTDNVGEWLLNVDLSLRRANSIRGRLAQLGVPAERIRVQGAGPEQPIADNESAEGRARNRRIEISISSGG